MNPFSATPPIRRRLLQGVIALLIVAVAAWVHGEAGVTVKWIVDGDTIILQDGRHVRYIGINTPEIDHQTHRAEPMGDEALAVNRQLVDGRPLRLVYDREKTDRYGRTLAYVYRRDGLFVNAALLRKGSAHVLYRFPNSAQAEILLAAQRHAMEQGRGIWRFVDKNETPARPYLGNRNSRRFHAPDCPLGKKTAATHRVWLKNRWKAFWHGYAPAKECIEFPMGDMQP